ncbi:transposase, partial [bacterium]|nr:transposase [bacterium]
MRLDHKYKQRRSIRLKGYDYSSSGWYFVTLCTKDRDCYFGEYPELMNIVLDEWNSIPNNFNNVELD